MAAEVYPAGPEDLRRKESKILVYERCPHIPEWGRPHVYPVEWSEDFVMAADLLWMGTIWKGNFAGEVIVFVGENSWTIDWDDVE